MTSPRKAYDTIIVGGGPAGLAAGIYLARVGFKALLLEEGSLGGQARLIETIENYPGFPRGISGSALMRRFLVQARLWGLAIKKTKVIEVRRRIEEFEIQTTRERLKAKAIILCAGSVFKKLGIPGENRLMGRGIYRVAFDEAFRFKGKKVAVVGGGDAAAHQALLLSRYAARVYLIYRGRNLKAHGLLQRRLKIAPKITALSQVVIESAEGNGALNGVHLKNLKTGSKSFLGIRALFILIGKAPNRGLLRAVKARQGAFLAGDACQGRFRQVAIASGDGMKAAMKCTQYLESVETSYGNC